MTGKIDSILSLFKQYAKQQDLLLLEKQIVPPMKRFEDIMQQYAKDNEQMREVVRRFDEVIIEKASKVSLHEMGVYVEAHYVKKRYWEQLEERIDGNIKEQETSVRGMQEAVK